MVDLQPIEIDEFIYLEPFYKYNQRINMAWIFVSLIVLVVGTVLYVFMM